MSKKEKKSKTAPENGIPKEIAARREIYDWIDCLLTALIISIILFVFFIRIIDVNGSSMYPTLENRDKMLVSHLFFKPKAGDVVVFKTDSYDPNKALVKRIIATEGQEINIDFDKGIVYVDGQELKEPYVNELTNRKLDFMGPKTVPEGCVFVMGDNRNASTDSRDSRIAMLDSRLIIGRAYYVLYPMNNLRAIE